MTFHYLWRIALRSSAERLWPFVSNTDRFRHATGFPVSTYTEEPLPEGGSRRIGRFHMYGFPIVWEEQPFQWIHEREFSEDSQYRVGPLGHTHIVVKLQPRADGGTDLSYEIWATTGNILGYPGIPVQIGLISRQRFVHAFHHLDEFIQSQVMQPFEMERTPISAAGRTRLQEYRSKLIEAGHAAALVDRLLDTVETAPDDELARMRPYVLADDWQADRYAVLELFVRATKLGLLDLSWDLVCPDCRGAKQHSHSLQGVSHGTHCPSCNIDFEVDFSRSVEATFQVNSAVKAVMRTEYCIGSPQNTPHVLAQQRLDPGETRTVTLTLQAQQYRWRVPGLSGKDGTPQTVSTLSNAASGRELLQIDARAQHSDCMVTVSEDGLSIQPAIVKPGSAAVTLTNRTSRPQVILIEQTEWSDKAATAAEVTSLQSFRDLFASEALRPGESISVGSLTLLFTDLKGSTMLYTSVGDAPAFRRVMDHFTILRDGVARHHGALVKTIGDAIMAVFPDPFDAVAASLDILGGIRHYNEEHIADTDDGQAVQPLVLKMGIHKGACIAVTLNERLDYFGSVVNLAARLEGQSQGDDVVISEAVASDPTVAAYLGEQPVRVEAFSANLKGFSDSYSLRRLALPDEAAVTVVPA